MKRTILVILMLAGIIHTTVSCAYADLVANFVVEQIRNLCNAQDVYDPWPAEGPDLLFRMGIIDDASASTLNYCADGCALQENLARRIRDIGDAEDDAKNDPRPKNLRIVESGNNP